MRRVAWGCGRTGGVARSTPGRPVDELEADFSPASGSELGWAENAVGAARAQRRCAERAERTAAENGRARRAWVDGDGSRSVTLGDPATARKVRGYRWPPEAVRTRCGAWSTSRPSVVVPRSRVDRSRRRGGQTGEGRTWGRTSGTWRRQSKCEPTRGGSKARGHPPGVLVSRRLSAPPSWTVTTGTVALSQPEGGNNPKSHDPTVSGLIECIEAGVQ